MHKIDIKFRYSALLKQWLYHIINNRTHTRIAKADQINLKQSVSQ